jgi:LEA14-like dessication related protein
MEKSMQKLKIMLILLIILNILFASILIIDIQLFKTPDILIEINILDVNSEEVILGSNIKIINPNGFDLIVSDLNIESKTKDGKKIGNIIIQGGKIPSNGEKNFNSTNNLRFESNNFDVIENTVSARVGVNILGFITKTIPLKITAIASFNEFLEKLSQPDVNINFAFDKLTEKGLNFSASVDIYNPTSFEFNIDTIYLDINTENNKNVGNIKILGSKIGPKSSEVFSSNGVIEFGAFDAKTLWMNVSGVAGVKIAGISKNISFSADASFDIPDIKNFIFVNESVDISLPVQFKFTLFGIKAIVGLRFYNPSEIPLVAKNMVCSISRLDGEKISVLSEEKMESCEIAPKKTICIKTQLLIPYIKYLLSFKASIFPDWIVLNIKGDFSIAGTRQAFPISINAFVDPHFLKNSELVITEE